MQELFNNFMTSGFKFTKKEERKKAQYQTLNVGLVLTCIALLYGIVGNIIRDVEGLILVETIIIILDIMLLIALRKYPKAFETIVIVMVSKFTFLFIFLVFISSPESIKFTWIFMYPMILLYLQNVKQSFYWMLFLISALILMSVQDYVQIDFTPYQITYIIVVLLIMNSITYFYQLKMYEANTKILQQQDELEYFNMTLEKKVNEKTSELQNLNDSLEIKVNEKIEELRSKDKILELQSKQAVMGEMISMIAHQWRQPLSTITLQIANLQFKKLLGEDLTSDNVDDALTEISDTIIYLSDTVDDFQTYFRPDKEMVDIEVNELLNRAINFASPRLQESDIVINMCENCTYVVKTYPNEFVQVVLNILNNSIDAHNELKKENPIINIDISTQGEFYIIKIADNAGGIKEENLSKLFEPYFSTKGKNGTGLGLYMSKMIIEKQFYGDLNIENSSQGATFIIRIPKVYR